MLITPELDDLFRTYFVASDGLYSKCQDSEWVKLELDKLTTESIAKWDLQTLLHIAAFNKESASRAIPLIQRYVEHFSEE